MDWISGIGQAIAYIEAHLADEVDFAEAARRSYSSPSHFARVFSILCGYTLGEYVRLRRLTLAGAELAHGDALVIDVALKYGYDSPDSFAKAFRAFHGISPSDARRSGAVLKSFSPLSFKISLEGGTIMDYRIEEKKAFRMLGYKRRFTGSPADRAQQEADFFVDTRLGQFLLAGMQHDADTQFGVLTNYGEDGYDYYIAGMVPDDLIDVYREPQYVGDEVADLVGLEPVEIPAGLWLVCETKRCQHPTNDFLTLRREAVGSWLPSAGYALRDAPEIEVVHWFNDDRYLQRYIEIWLPIEKI
ncbi:MAG: AraC family transcriptional regulator [Clostridia bacterium]|nr:AraC family transcriptional regulator [Clostridia bacterium]